MAIFNSKLLVITRGYLFTSWFSTSQTEKTLTRPVFFGKVFRAATQQKPHGSQPLAFSSHVFDKADMAICCAPVVLYKSWQTKQRDPETEWDRTCGNTFWKTIGDATPSARLQLRCISICWLQIITLWEYKRGSGRSTISSHFCLCVEVKIEYFQNQMANIHVNVKHDETLYNNY